MRVLHLVNRAPALARCLSVAGLEDSILLIEAGVTAAFEDCDRSIFVLNEDLGTKNVQRLGRNVEAINRREFVALVVEHEPIVSWR